MELKNMTSALGAAAAGAAAIYLLDPEQGRRRRSLVRDQLVRAGHSVGDNAGVVARDLAHRTQGLVAQQRSRLLSRGDVPPLKLEERARAALGRVVSHPRAISVTALDGTLVVSGYILEQEVEPLLSALKSVPGVKEIDNRLEVGEHPERMPSLQGGRSRPGRMPDLFQRRMAPATRLLLGIGAGGLLAYGLSRRGMLGNILTGVGAMAGLRAASNLPYGRLFGWRGRESVRLQNAIEISAPVEEVFDFFRHFGNFPRFMQHIRRVEKLDEGTWHWEADGPLGITVSWDAVVTRLEPNRRISWKSVQGSEIKQVGTVWFDRVGPNRTRIQVLMGYNPPAGAVGHGVSVLLGANPLRQMDDDLVRLKSIIERGKTSAHGEEVTRDELRAR